MSALNVTGRCHCGRVTFNVVIGVEVRVQQCNCSICAMLGYLHLIVPANRFFLLSGKNALVEYRFNSGIARHLFCAGCGVKSFYVPRSNPDGISVNLRCLDLPDSVIVRLEYFDGRHWQLHAAALRNLSGSET